MEIGVIVTIPPYARFLEEVSHHPLVCGFRLNTVMPLHEEKTAALQRLSSLGQPLWVDLKSRQLRVVGAAIPPYTEVQISHPIRVNTPVTAFFSDGLESVQVVSVSGDRLILEDGPQRLIGPGESLNIVHPSLEIEGTLTPSDLAYIEAMKELGLRNIMLSFVESPEDAREILSMMPDANLVLKVESQKGLKYIARSGSSQGHLMAARGDLYVEVPRPHKIIPALRSIIEADPHAIAASRILGSLVRHPVPQCADLGDIAFLISLGYRTFMLGDELCLQRETVLEALNLLQAVAGELS